MDVEKIADVMSRYYLVWYVKENGNDSLSIFNNNDAGEMRSSK